MNIEPLRIPSSTSASSSSSLLRGMQNSKGTGGGSNNCAISSNYAAAATGTGYNHRSGQAPSHSSSASYSRQPSRVGVEVTYDADLPPTPMCGCQMPSIIRTVNKEGANKGRTFFTCSKPQGAQCGFFSFCDDSSSSNNRGSAGGGGFRASGGGGAVAPSNPGIICSRCRGEGHWARSCPNK